MPLARSVHRSAWPASVEAIRDCVRSTGKHSPGHGGNGRSSVRRGGQQAGRRARSVRRDPYFEWHPLVVEAPFQLRVVFAFPEEPDGHPRSSCRDGDLASQLSGGGPADEGADRAVQRGVGGEPKVEVLLARGGQVEMVLVEPGQELDGAANVGAIMRAGTGCAVRQSARRSFGGACWWCPCGRERPMLLVPRQLRRVGMTGDVPYYGGRLTPAQAYAASHPQARPAAPPPAPPPAPPSDQQLAALQHLLDSGVITSEEYQRLRARVSS